MRLALHTIICCCLFTMVLPLIKGAPELNSTEKKRFKIWLQSHIKRGLSSSLEATNEWYSDTGPQQDMNTIIVSPPSSFDLNIRHRRSVSSKTTGCSLGTCVYHDLLHNLYKIQSKPTDAKAPQGKMGKDGYGRRRRSLPGVTQLKRRSSETGQRARSHRSTCTVA